MCALTDAVAHGLIREQDLQDAVAHNRRTTAYALGALRRAAKLSCRQAAALLRCDASNLNKLEHGRTWNPDLMGRALLLYASYLNTAADVAAVESESA